MNFVHTSRWCAPAACHEGRFTHFPVRVVRTSLLIKMWFIKLVRQGCTRSTGDVTVESPRVCSSLQHITVCYDHAGLPESHHLLGSSLEMILFFAVIKIAVSSAGEIFNSFQGIYLSA